MVDGANEEKVEVQEGSQQTDESVKTESSEQENQEGQAIPYERFKQVNAQKNEYKTKSAEYEKQLQEMAWVNDLNTILEKDPSKEKQIIDILMGKEAPKKDVEDEDLDPRDKEIAEIKAKMESLEGNISHNTEKQQNRIYASYEDDFQSKVEGVKKDTMLNTMLKMATQTVLDSEFKGWRDRHIPGIMDKAYAKVQDEFDTYLNTKKKDYIDNKTKSDTPDIGKGASGNAIDKVPIGDSDKMKEYAARFMKGEIS